MKKLIAPAIIVAAGMIAAPAWSQTPPANNVVQYFTTPLENDASRIVRLQAVNIPPKGGTPFPRQPADQWAAVQEGEITFTVKGQPPRVLKPGDSVFIPRGVVHRNQNLTDKPARSVELVILDAIKPGLEVVSE